MGIILWTAYLWIYTVYVYTDTCICMYIFICFGIRCHSEIVTSIHHSENLVFLAHNWYGIEFVLLLLRVIYSVTDVPKTNRLEIGHDSPHIGDFEVGITWYYYIIIIIWFTQIGVSSKLIALQLLEVHNFHTARRWGSNCLPQNSTRSLGRWVYSDFQTRGT